MLLEGVARALYPQYELHIFDNGTDWKHDRDLFSHAVVVFGAHGGAHANMIYMPPDSHVVEFLGGPTVKGGPMEHVEAEAGHPGHGHEGNLGTPFQNERPCYQGLVRACTPCFLVWLVCCLIVLIVCVAALWTNLYMHPFLVECHTFFCSMNLNFLLRVSLSTVLMPWRRAVRFRVLVNEYRVCT